MVVVGVYVVVVHAVYVAAGAGAGLGLGERAWMNSAWESAGVVMGRNWK